MKFFIIFATFVACTLAEDAQPSTSDPRVVIHQRELIVLDSVDDFPYKFNASKAPSRPGAAVRISNGNTARDGQFPFAAFLVMSVSNYAIHCTGSLIASNWVLSARHCIADTNARSALAALGSSDRENPAVKIFSSSMVWMNVGNGPHPDIAVFKLAQNAPNNDRVRPIALPRRRDAGNGFDRWTATAAGYGGGKRYLQYTQFKIIGWSDGCNLGKGLLCSQPPSGSSSLEGGDSGGPLFVDVDGVRTQIGVNVVVVGDGKNVWQGSTKVTDYLNFIHDTTGIPYR